MPAKRSRGWLHRRRKRLLLVGTAQLLLWLLLLLLHSPLPLHAASQMPGVPVPFDSANSRGSGVTWIPREQYIFTAGRWVYQYDPVMQHTLRLYDIDALFDEPVGSSLNLGGEYQCNANGTLEHLGGYLFNQWNASTWWRDRAYFFAESVYVRWRAAGGSQVGISNIAEGWMDGVEGLDGWLTEGFIWSYAFIGDKVHTYNNFLDAGDGSVAQPRLLSVDFPGMPQNQSDSDIELGRCMWVVWRGKEMWLYNRPQLRVYPGYPRLIHDDEQDGGLNGMNRTRCSGCQDLSSMLGFVEDKSPGERFRAMNYAGGLNCSWSITAPANLIKQAASGVQWQGMSVQFTRFDLGSAAAASAPGALSINFPQLFVYELLDMPPAAELARMSSSNYRLVLKDPSVNLAWSEAGGPFAIPDEPPARRMIAQFNASFPPPLNTTVHWATEGMTLQVEFVTPAVVPPLLELEAPAAGTGFALQFAMRSPAPVFAPLTPLTPAVSSLVSTYSTSGGLSALRSYRAKHGLFWFGCASLRRPCVEHVLLEPDVLSPRYQLLDLTIAFQMLPNNVPEYWDAVSLTVTALTEGDLGSGQQPGQVLMQCKGASMFKRGFEVPRCIVRVFGPVMLTWNVSVPLSLASTLPPGPGGILDVTLPFHATAAGDYVSSSYCNNPSSDPLIHSSLSGSLDDGSGLLNRYVGPSSCSWLIRAPEAAAGEGDVLFIAAQPTSFGLNEEVLDTVEFFDAPNTSAAIQDATRITTLRGSYATYAAPWKGEIISDLAGPASSYAPLVRSTGPMLSILFSSSAVAHGDGFNISYVMVLPPLVSSLSMHGFTPMEVDELAEGTKATLQELGSRATGLLYAGVTTANIAIQALDKHGDPALLHFDDWFRFFLRFIPVTPTFTSDPSLLRALQLYPSSLSETTPEWWEAEGYSISAEDLAMVAETEYTFTRAKLDFRAPVRGDMDYNVTLLYVLAQSGTGGALSNPPLSSATTQGLTESPFAARTWSTLAYHRILRVTAYRASPTMSSFFCAHHMLPSEESGDATPPSTGDGAAAASSTGGSGDAGALSLSVDSSSSASSSSTGANEGGNTTDALPSGSGSCTIENSLGVLCNADFTCANGNFTVGRTARFMLVTRDAFGNRMEDLHSRDDVRAFLQSSSIHSSPPAMLEGRRGIYTVAVTPTIAADDYVLTVMVSGSDVLEGPFAPLFLPGNTSAAASTLHAQSTGLSLLTFSLPVGDDVAIVLTLRDGWGNVQRAEVADSDHVEFEWPGKAVRLATRVGAVLTYLVDLPSYEPKSLIRVTINGAPLGFDPTSPSADALGLAQGILVGVGSLSITPYVQPAAVQIALSFFAALCIVLTLLLLFYIHRYRHLAPIRASAPTFLVLMLVGACFSYATLFSLSLPESTEVSCVIEPLLGHFGFILLFGSLILKTQRVRTIWKDSRLTQQRYLSDTSLGVRLALMLAAFVVYFAVWMSLARPVPHRIEAGANSFIVCESEAHSGGGSSTSSTRVSIGADVFPSAILIVEAVYVCYGAYLAASIWSLPSQWNESKALFAATYNVVVIGGLLTLLVKAVLDKPDQRQLFTCIGVLVVTSAVVLSMFGYKLWLLWSPSSNTRAAKFLSASSVSGVTDATHVGDSRGAPSLEMGATLRASQRTALTQGTVPSAVLEEAEEPPPSSAGQTYMGDGGEAAGGALPLHAPPGHVYNYGGSTHLPNIPAHVHQAGQPRHPTSRFGNIRTMPVDGPGHSGLGDDLSLSGTGEPVGSPVLPYQQQEQTTQQLQPQQPQTLFAAPQQQQQQRSKRNSSRSSSDHSKNGPARGKLGVPATVVLPLPLGAIRDEGHMMGPIGASPPPRDQWQQGQPAALPSASPAAEIPRPSLPSGAGVGIIRVSSPSRDSRDDEHNGSGGHSNEDGTGGTGIGGAGTARESVSGSAISRGQFAPPSAGSSIRVSAVELGSRTPMSSYPRGVPSPSPSGYYLQPHSHNSLQLPLHHLSLPLGSGSGSMSFSIHRDSDMAASARIIIGSSRLQGMDDEALQASHRQPSPDQPPASDSGDGNSSADVPLLSLSPPTDARPSAIPGTTPGVTGTERGVAGVIGEAGLTAAAAMRDSAAADAAAAAAAAAAAHIREHAPLPHAVNNSHDD